MRQFKIQSVCYGNHFAGFFGVYFFNRTFAPFQRLRQGCYLLLFSESDSFPPETPVAR